jgi:hypothetical protein
VDYVSLLAECLEVMLDRWKNPWLFGVLLLERPNGKLFSYEMSNVIA